MTDDERRRGPVEANALAWAVLQVFSNRNAALFEQIANATGQPAKYRSRLARVISHAIVRRLARDAVKFAAKPAGRQLQRLGADAVADEFAHRWINRRGGL